MITPRTLASSNAPFRKGLLYGGPGTGKSVLACGSLQRNTFVFDVDNGIDSVMSFRTKYGLRMDNVLFHPITSMKDFREGWQWVASNPRWINDGVVVIDSATELQRIALREASGKKSYPEQKEWGKLLKEFEDMFSDMRHGYFNMVITAHEFQRVDSDLGREVWRPSFQGRFAVEYAKHLSFIGRLVNGFVPNPPDQYGRITQSLFRAVNFGPDPFVHYKDRSGMLSNFEHPDLDWLLYKMLSVPEFASQQMQAQALPTPEQYYSYQAPQLPQSTA